MGHTCGTAFGQFADVFRTTFPILGLTSVLCPDAQISDARIAKREQLLNLWKKPFIDRGTIGVDLIPVAVGHTIRGPTQQPAELKTRMPRGITETHA